MHEGRIHFFFSWGNTPDKNHQGDLNRLSKNEESMKSYLFDSPDDNANDVVRLIQKYASYQPNGMNTPDSFYLAINDKATEGKWSKNSRLGENTLGKILSTICESLRMQGKFTNHSWRRRIPTLMYQTGIDEQTIMEVTEHNSVGGVRAYKKTSFSQQVNAADFNQLKSGEKYKQVIFVLNLKIQKEVATVIGVCSPIPSSISAPMVQNK